MKHWILGTSLAVANTLCQAYSFDFTGRITYTDSSLAGVAVGTTFTGRMEGQGAMSVHQSGNVAEFRFDQGQVSAQIGTHHIVADNPRLEVWDNWGGNVEDAFTMSSGYRLRVNQTVYRDGTFSFNLTTRPGNTGVIQGFGLPSQVDVAAFDGHPSLTYGSLRRDGSSNGTVLGFEVTSVSVTPVPEPATALLTLSGALLAAGLAHRKRNAA
jgi:hypothetical protein